MQAKTIDNITKDDEAAPTTKDYFEKEEIGGNVPKSLKEYIVNGVMNYNLSVEKIGRGSMKNMTELLSHMNTEMSQAEYQQWVEFMWSYNKKSSQKALKHEMINSYSADYKAFVLNPANAAYLAYMKTLGIDEYDSVAPVVHMTKHGSLKLTNFPHLKGLTKNKTAEFT